MIVAWHYLIKIFHINIENSTPSFSGFYPDLTLAAAGLSSEK